jgi:CPA1 family monovalent cation:H+ antiporter
LSGVRGALTLAAAFSIPMTLADNSPFPERSLILCICSGVILLTLVIASVLLPILTREAKADPEELAENERNARIRVLEAGLNAVREEMNDKNSQEGMRLISSYTRRLQMAKLKNKAEMGNALKEAVDIRLEALKAEQKIAEKWVREERISPKLADKFLSSISKVEMLLTTRRKWTKLLVFGWEALQRLLRKSKKKAKKIDISHPQWGVYRELKLEAIRAAIRQVKSLETADNKDTIQAILADYRGLELQLQSGSYRNPAADQMSAERREIELKAIQAERNEIQIMFENGEISRTLANNLRLDVNYHEGHLFETQTVHDGEGEH